MRGEARSVYFLNGDAQTLFSSYFLCYKNWAEKQKKHKRSGAAEKRSFFQKQKYDTLLFYMPAHPRTKTTLDMISNALKVDEKE